MLIASVSWALCAGRAPCSLLCQPLQGRHTTHQCVQELCKAHFRGAQSQDGSLFPDPETAVLVHSVPQTPAYGLPVLWKEGQLLLGLVSMPHVRGTWLISGKGVNRVHRHGAGQLYQRTQELMDLVCMVQKT